jgi:hypothetical protein
VDKTSPLLWRCTPNDGQTFTIRLHFAEPEDVKPGQRIFDVRIQGRDVLKALDIAAAAGGARRALTKEFRDIKASDTIILSLVPVKGSKLPAVLCGAEIETEK